MKPLVLIIAFFLSATLSVAQARYPKNYYDENTLWGLAHKSHQAEGEAKAVVLMSHGLIHHSGNFPSLLKSFREQGIKVVTYDLRGHGMSHGVRGHITNFNSFVADLSRMVDLVKQHNPDLPLILYGHSMGGLITYLYLATDHGNGKIDGAILSAPALKFPLGIIDQVKMSSAGVIRQFAPKFHVPVELDTTKLTDIPFKADKLRLPGMTVSLGDELNKASVSVHEGGVVPIVDVPLLIIQGRKDPIVDADYIIQKSRELTTSENVLVLEEALHEPFNSSQKIQDAYLEGISHFLDKIL